MSTSVSVDVYARDRSASKTFDHVGSSATRSSGLVSKFGTALAGAFTGAALYNGGRDLVRLFTDLTSGAAEDEVASRRLALQLRNSADATNKQVSSTEDWITKIGQQIGITDDELRPALTRAVTATHDVREAQEQVSLAMDVSAGKGKSLSTVEEALAKARQGTVSGLSRLGAVTKDASGKTLTYEQITKQLAETYRGQASQAADTAAGKYERLTTQFSELGETIGYALLPKATAFGGWILDNGVPAAEKLVHWLGDELGPVAQDLGGWFSENKDELKDFGREVVDDVIPALKTAAQVGGDAVDMFMQLPGPVKKIAAEVGIAALVFPKLSSAMNGMQLAGFISNMRSAEDRTAALGRAAKSTAGAGGLALLFDSTQRSNDSVSALEGALGGAAVGFSAGGPVGAAIGGLAGGVGTLAVRLARSSQNAADAYQAIGAYDPVDEAHKSIDGLRGTLDELTGAYTGATRAAALKMLQDQGLVSVATQNGISQRELVNAALGQKGAWSAIAPVVSEYGSKISGVTAQQQALLHSTDNYLNSTSAVAGDYDLMNVKAQNQYDALEKTKKGYQENLNVLKLMPGQLKAMGDEVRDNAKATADYTGKLHGLPSEVKTNILQEGIDPSRRAIADLAKQYSLTPKQIKTLISATGVPTTVAQVQSVIDRLAAVHDKTVTLTTIQKVVSFVTGQKSSGGGAAGGALPPGAAGRTAGGAAPGGVPPDLLKLPHHIKKLGDDARQMLVGLVNGIRTGKKPLDNVLDAITTNLQNKTDRWQSLLDEASGFADGFNWTSSVFGMQSSEDSGPLTVAQILAQAGAERAKSAQVNTDVQKLIGAGLSTDLIQQLQSQGEQGVESLHVLASASQDQINQLVADNAATQSNYAAAGKAAADRVYGASINAAAAQKASAQALTDAAREIKDFKEKLGDVKFQLAGPDLVAVFERDKKAKGKKGDK